MAVQHGDILKLLTQDLSDIKIDQDVSLLSDFSNKQKVSHFSDLCLLQLCLARQAVVVRSGYLGEQLNEGKFLETGIDGSGWELYHLNDGTRRVAALWNHFDDDSWLVFFEGDNLKLAFLAYEN